MSDHKNLKSTMRRKATRRAWVLPTFGRELEGGAWIWLGSRVAHTATARARPSLARDESANTPHLARPIGWSMRHLLIALYSCCYAFVPPLAPRQRRHHHAIIPRSPSCSSSSHGHPYALRATREQAENDGDADNERTPEMELASNWQYQRVRLEEQFTRERRRRGPRHLPYEAARSWAAHQGCTSEREWREWVDLGEGWSSVRTYTQLFARSLPPPCSSLFFTLSPSLRSTSRHGLTNTTRRAATGSHGNTFSACSPHPSGRRLMTSRVRLRKRGRTWRGAPSE